MSNYVGSSTVNNSSYENTQVALPVYSHAYFLGIKTDKGEIHISKGTIESISRYSFKDIAGIISSDAKVKMARKPEDTKIIIKLTLIDNSDIIDISQTIQCRIENALKTTMGFSTVKIIIKIDELKPANKRYKEPAKGSRVI